MLAKMAAAFADNNVSIHSMMQRGAKGDGRVDVVYVTHVALESDVRSAIDHISAIDGLLFAEPSVIRVEE